MHGPMDVKYDEHGLRQHKYLCAHLGKSYELLLSVKWSARKWNIRIPRNVGTLFGFVIFGRALNAKFNGIHYHF